MRPDLHECGQETADRQSGCREDVRSRAGQREKRSSRRDDLRRPPRATKPLPVRSARQSGPAISATSMEPPFRVHIITAAMKLAMKLLTPLDGLWYPGWA